MPIASHEKDVIRRSVSLAFKEFGNWYKEGAVVRGSAFKQESIRFNEAGYLDCLEQEWKGIEKIGPPINEVWAHRSDLA